jgi:hypothetical protein
MAGAAGIGVVHLVWAPLGTAPLARFLAAYRQNPGGAEHRLAVMFNGFGSEAERAPFRSLLAGVPHQELSMPEPAQDIPAYLAAARALPCEFICFLNSYSEPLDAGWLAKLHRHASAPGVGLVGATGSWESFYSAARRPAEPPPRTLRPRGVAGWLVRTAGRGRADLALRRHFRPFPNPHVRSNGFMLARDLLLGLRARPIRTKRDAERFESGRSGLTRQVLARGLRVLVVGRDGRGYLPAEWPESRTFRSGSQENLLIADNRTAQYAQADAPMRALLRTLAWGRA